MLRRIEHSAAATAATATAHRNRHTQMYVYPCRSAAPAEGNATRLTLPVVDCKMVGSWYFIVYLIWCLRIALTALVFQSLDGCIELFWLKVPVDSLVYWYRPD